MQRHMRRKKRLRTSANDVLTDADA